MAEEICCGNEIVLSKIETKKAFNSLNKKVVDMYGWVELQAGLRIACSNQKLDNGDNVHSMTQSKFLHAAQQKATKGHYYKQILAFKMLQV